MTKEEFEQQFSKQEIDSMIEKAFQVLRKNQGLPLMFISSELEDNLGTCIVNITYKDIYTEKIIPLPLVELLFTQPKLLSDDRSLAYKAKDMRTRTIVRIAWRVGNQYTHTK